MSDDEDPDVDEPFDELESDVELESDELDSDELLLVVDRDDWRESFL